MEEPEMQLKVKKVTDKFTESLYVLANEPSVALFRLQEHVRRSLPELAQHKSDMQSWEEQSQGAIYTVEYACSAIKGMADSGVYFKGFGIFTLRVKFLEFWAGKEQDPGNELGFGIFTLRMKFLEFWAGKEQDAGNELGFGIFTLRMKFLEFWAGKNSRIQGMSWDLRFSL
ncbi:BLOC-1-related complex subunit 8 isoform X1 [Prinia subflava]|uniref:BLOC-1-related complex subunit 8 isoform X1 n=1 Tax=Prinia subflava TaxID=208062 RepID=UPI002FE1C4A4